MATTSTFVQMIFDRWYGALKNWDACLDALSDNDLQREIAPGKTRGIYLLGHMVAVHDDMVVLLGMGEKTYPELFEPFIKSPDKVATDLPSAATLRKYWKDQCAALKEKFDALQPADWFGPHTAVSADDFPKEPNRNKLNIILTRTTHMTYHTGQLILLK